MSGTPFLFLDGAGVTYESLTLLGWHRVPTHKRATTVEKIRGGNQISALARIGESA
jgi:hypothetical protein